MKSTSPALDFMAVWLWRRRADAPEIDPKNPRILVIRRNRMGDMICTLPLLHALRKNYPTAHLVVACDAAGAPIARACPAVNEVMVLEARWNRWLMTVRNAARLQDFDWVIAVKGGFDRRLAVLARLTNAARRIGFEGDPVSRYYTAPVALPENPNEEHQIETTLRLLQPLGISSPAIDLTLALPPSATAFAQTLLAKPPFSDSLRYMLINISSTSPLKFQLDDFVTLAQRILSATDLSIGFVAAPSDQPKARELAARVGSSRAVAIATPGPLELAALLERAQFIVTPEGGAAHLAAAVNKPALVLWSEGPFQKWRSRGPGHVFVQRVKGEEMLSLDRVWREIQPFLSGSSGIG